MGCIAKNYDFTSHKSCKKGGKNLFDIEVWEVYEKIHIKVPVK